MLKNIDTIYNGYTKLELSRTLINNCSRFDKYVVVLNARDVNPFSVYFTAIKIGNKTGYIHLLTNSIANQLYYYRTYNSNTDKKSTINRFKQKSVARTSNLFTDMKNADLIALNAEYDALVNTLSSCVSTQLKSAGGKNGKYTRTKDPKVKTPKGMRCVYVGRGGAKYVKLGGVFVNIKKL